MPQGIQVFNSSGRVVFDTNTKTIKVLADFKITPNMDISFTHPLLLKETPFYIITPVAVGALIEQITISSISGGFRIRTNNLTTSQGRPYPNVDFLKITIGAY